MTEGKPLHKFWWLWVPLVFLALQLVLEFTMAGPDLSRLLSENGPHETLQTLVLLMALIVAVRALFLIDWKTQYWLGGWLGLAAVSCFYVSGEEISWGQHILQWDTPEYWARVNDQQETNLHNTSSWLDQKPRLILEIGVIVGGIVIPLLEKFRKSLLPERFTIIYPPAVLAVTASVVLFFKLSEKLTEGLGISFYVRVSEVIELGLYYFVLLYLVILMRRIVAKITV